MFLPPNFLLCTQHSWYKCHYHIIMMTTIEIQEVTTNNMSPLQASDHVDDSPALIQGIFSISPFGLGCRLCPKKVSIQINERCIREHVKKHGFDSRAASIRSLFDTFVTKLEVIKAAGTIEPYRIDNRTYKGFSCICGEVFPRKDNARRHCTRVGCDPSRLQKVELIEMCCGRYVTQAQVDTLFNNNQPRIKHQFNYQQARAILLPFLPKREKQDHTYTHMYIPLITGCGGGSGFTEKIKADFVSIHSSPNQSGESVLIQIQEQAENWLLNFAQKNILMVPGNLRAALQTFEGGEVDDVSQRCIYRMQHDPKSLLSELKKLLAFAYRRGLFTSWGFDNRDEFAVAYFLKEFLLEVPESVASHPFVVEFCLMYPFRVSSGKTADNPDIVMISCDTMSSLISKVSSLLKAAVCSVICSYSEHTFIKSGTLLVESVRKAPVIHILSPMVRQIKEMYNRLPKRQKTILHPEGNITVDQFLFSYDLWSRIVPLTISLMQDTLTHLAIGSWWEPVVDPATFIKVKVDTDTSDFDKTIL